MTQRRKRGGKSRRGRGGGRGGATVSYHADIVRHVASVNVTGTPSGMPTVKKATQKYFFAEKFPILAAQNNMGFVKIQANGMWKPNALNPHQPMGYDEMTKLYGHYVVTKSWLRATCYSATSGELPNLVTHDVTFGIHLSDDGLTPWSSINQYVEGGKGTHAIMMRTATAPRSVLSKFDAKTFFQVEDVRDNINRIGAHVGANPKDDAIFLFWCHGTSMNVEVQFEVAYEALFSEPTDLPKSVVTSLQSKDRREAAAQSFEFT